MFNGKVDKIAESIVLLEKATSPGKENRTPSRHKQEKSKESKLEEEEPLPLPTKVEKQEEDHPKTKARQSHQRKGF